MIIKAKQQASANVWRGLGGNFGRGFRVKWSPPEVGEVGGFRGMAYESNLL